MASIFRSMSYAKMQQLVTAGLPAINPGDFIYTSDTQQLFIVCTTTASGKGVAPTNQILTGSIELGFSGTPSGVPESTLLFTIDGGAPIATDAGVVGFVTVPYDCEISGWTLLGDIAGNAIVDVAKTSLANFPNSFASITSGDRPTLSNAQKNSSDASAWSKTLSKGDVLQFTVVSTGGTIKRLNLSINVSLNLS